MLNKKPDWKEYTPYSFIYVKYKSKALVGIVATLGRGEDSDKRRALGALWGTGNLLLLVHSAGYWVCSVGKN